MEWSNEQCLALIDQYERFPLLWDPKHSFYHSKTKKEDAWEAISKNLSVESAIVRKKMASLLGSFRAQRSRAKKTTGTVKGRTDVYVSKWFAFERMKFLLDKYELKTNIETEITDVNLNDSNDSLDEVEETIAQQNDNEYLSIEQSESALNERQNLNLAQNTEQVENSRESTTQKPQLKKFKKRMPDEDPRIGEAFKILENIHARSGAQTQSMHDRFEIYGQHIAHKLRNYTFRTEAIVEHAINNILFEADMGNYDNHHGTGPGSSSHSHFIQSPVPSPVPSDSSSF